ncbi:MAG TPA: AsnC family transcriptional regulator [Solirubrobacteraceae bacterium]
MPDLLDTQLLHALQLDGRAPFSTIADVLGVSDQTIARRYSRLHDARRLRVRGLSDAQRLRDTRWIVRVQCTPNAAAAAADALARRPDTSWISLTSGGTEIVCVVRTTSGEQDNRLLLQTLPRNRFVVAMTAHCVLHTFFGDPAGLINKLGSLSKAQVARLRRPPVLDADGPVSLTAVDRKLFTLLEHDGRATFAELSAATDASQTTVRRRIAELRTNGTLYFDVDFDQALLDLHVRAMVWLSVAPSQLAAVGEALAGHPETAYVAATTGASNLYASVVCADTAALYAYLTTRIARLTGIERIETVPIVRSVKRGGLLGPT